MPLNKTLREVVITGKQRLQDGVKQFFGTDEDVSLQFDASVGSNGAIVVRDEANAQNQMVLELGNDIATELESGGQTPLTIGNLLNFDPVEVTIGDTASQPAAGTADRVYIRTDATGGPVIERDDGAAWNVIGASPGALEDGGGAELTIHPTQVNPQGPGSGLNADTVDGKDASELGGSKIQRDRAGDAYITSTENIPNQTVTANGFQTSNNPPGWTTSASVTYQETLVKAGAVGKVRAKGKVQDQGMPNHTHTFALYRDGTHTVYKTIHTNTSGTTRDTVTYTYTNPPTGSHTWTWRCKAHNNNGEYLDMETQYLTGYGGGSTTLTASPATTHNPVWLSWTSAVPANGTWTIEQKADGQTPPRKDWLFGTLTNSAPLQFVVNFTGVTAATTFTGSWTMREGTTA